MKKICPICRKEFNANSNSAKYCSIECRSQSPTLQSHVGEIHQNLKIIGMRWDGRRMIANCLCSNCGSIKEIRYDSVVSGKIIGCGCLKEKNLFKGVDLTERTSGRLKAIRPVEFKKKYSTGILWECRCDCGNITYVTASDFTSRRITSCGCRLSETGKQNIKQAQKACKEFIKDGTNYKAIENENPIKTNTSGWRNISWDNARCKWTVRLVYKGKTYFIDRFDNLETAVKIRDLAREARKKDQLAEWTKEYRGSEDA